jgi:hypothetical protein
LRRPPPQKYGLHYYAVGPHADAINSDARATKQAHLTDKLEDSMTATLARLFAILGAFLFVLIAPRPALSDECPFPNSEFVRIIDSAGVEKYQCRCKRPHFTRAGNECKPIVWTLTIWIKAFIPNKHDTNPGFIRPRPGVAGQTMIPGPNIPFTDISVPLVGKFCYNTNNRGFSMEPGAEAKITSFITLKVSIEGLREASIAAPVLHPTQEYDCHTGQVTCVKTANPDTVKVSQPAVSGKTITFSMNGDAANPCIHVSAALTPSIKYHGIVTVDVEAGTVTFKGTTADFPSYEAYLSVDGKTPTPIFQLPPEPHSTAWALVFNRPVNQTVRYAPPRE